MARRIKADGRAKLTDGSETIALGTAAGAMALGVLASTDERVAADNAAPKDIPHTPPQPHTAAGAELSASTVTDGAMHTAVHSETAPAAAVEVPVETTKPAGEPHDQTAPLSHTHEPQDLAGAANPLAHQGTETPHSASAHDIAPAQEPIVHAASPLDSALTSLGDTVSALGATLHDVPGVPQVTQFLNETVSDVTHWTAAATSDAAGALVGAVFDQPPHIDQVPAMPLIDASALIQTIAAPPPLTLGFMGQPQPDAHDGGHDGAFSALGLHHF